ncbi:pyruvoyl-dependent arginine decarboxylase [Chlamydia sp. 17-3921]|uniref:pyruvoyl-dependent arginine decarboxylase AaxB n=1 Tax=Chlamydia sp. 17-3921 TaxID=2675798 RepID=UPI001918F729|nr:pyruvoyl-dependent arginine decarboxylase [Chlamydia sp. 17-3921]
MAYGTRYPTLAFHTGGVGESDDGMPPQPYETFCYDTALLQAKIENFNLVSYTSVLPKELFGNIVPVDTCVKHFKHGAVLEVIMAGRGASTTEGTQAIATGIGICWGQNKNGELIGGWAAEYIEFFPTWINEEITEAHAKMWLKKSLQHELNLRSVAKHSDFQYFYNYINIKKKFGFCLTALGFLNFENADAVTVN